MDPGVTSGTPQARMKISQSVVGTARAKVIAPIGKFHVVNANFTNYQAYVAGNTSLTLSGEDSTDPNGHITAANFTWRFTPPGTTTWGIRTNFTYMQAGQSIVNLTVKEVSGNLTYRNITLFVDDQLPNANIKTNKTGSNIADGLTLCVDEGTVVRFDGSASTDFAYTGKVGVILDSGYAWDFNGDRLTDATGHIVSWTLQKPGTFTINLTVTDSVGWKSVNATMTAIVNDTKGPVPAFDILDPEKDWGVITSPFERKTIALNASRTTDNYNNISALTFTWTIPGPLVGSPGPTHTFSGVNITFAWQDWNLSYNVKLAVHDTGFPNGKWNWGNLSRNITVQIDNSLHADLFIALDPTTHQSSMKVSPTDPAEGDSVTVSVNVTNKANRLAASLVVTNLSAISGGQTSLLAQQAQWFDKNGNPTSNRSIAAGDTVRLVFTVPLFGQGNKTIKLCAYDATEPYTWRTAENCASLPVNVRQPAWQPYAIYLSVIGVIVLFVFGVYSRSKINAGERSPIRGRRRAKGVDAATLRGLPHGRRELGDPANQHLFLRVHQETQVRRAVSISLGENAARTRVGVLEERRGVALEAQSLLPTERDRLLRLDANDVVADRRHPDRLGDLPFPRLREILAALRDLRIRAIDRFIDQIIEVDHASFARRHPALRQVDEGVEDRFRRPVDPHQLEGGLQSLERKFVVLSDDVDRDVTPAHLVQMVRDVPGRVQGRPVAPHEEVFRGVPFEAETGQVEVAGAVFLLAEGHQTLDHPLDAPIEDRVALPEERVVCHVDAAKGFQDAAEDGLPDFPDVFRQLDVAALEALREPFDLTLQGLIALEFGARLLIQLHVAVLDPLL